MGQMVFVKKIPAPSPVFLFYAPPLFLLIHDIHHDGFDDSLQIAPRKFVPIGNDF